MWLPAIRVWRVAMTPAEVIVDGRGAAPLAVPSTWPPESGGYVLQTGTARVSEATHPRRAEPAARARERPGPGRGGGWRSVRQPPGEGDRSRAPAPGLTTGLQRKWTGSRQLQPQAPQRARQLASAPSAPSGRRRRWAARSRPRRPA